jgi:hypothetical protein
MPLARRRKLQPQHPAAGAETPIHYFQALKAWKIDQSDPFKKKVMNIPGLDTWLF